MISKRFVLYALFLVLSSGLLVEGQFHTGNDPFWVLVIGHFLAGLGLITVLYSRRLAEILAWICWVAFVAGGEIGVAWYWISSGQLWKIGAYYFKSPQDWYTGAIRCPDCTYVDVSSLTTLVMLAIVVVMGLRQLNEFLIARENRGGHGSSIRPAA